MTEPGRERCLNCDAPLTGPWCARCGQQDLDPDPSVREFAHEATKELIEWDGRLLHTIRALVRSPGLVTREYVAGRRARWVPPMRLYLITSVAFFLLSSAIEAVTHRDQQQLVHLTLPDSMTTAAGTGKRTLRPEIAKELDQSSVTRVMGASRLQRALEDPKAFTDAVNAAFPRTIFALVPFFALMLFLVYRRQMPRYVPHLFFAFHFHAFGFLLFGVRILLLAPVASPVARAIAGAVSQIGLLIYLVAAMRTFYGGGLLRSLGKGALVMLGYGCCFLVGISVMGLLTLIFF